MNAQPTFATPRPVRTIAAVATATIIALTVLWAVASLFQSRGVPFEQLAAAERACATHAYQSERQACIDERIAEWRKTAVAAQ